MANSIGMAELNMPEMRKRCELFLRDPDRVEAEFVNLSRQIESDTKGSSSVQTGMLHPSYRRIIALGRQAVPCLLHNLHSNPKLWLEALHDIVGDRSDPVTRDMTVAEAVEAWLSWGRQQGFIE